MVRLRLRRVGRKNQASFRIVAAEKETKRDGRFLEVVGFYNPRTEPETIQLKEDLIYKWLKNGAQPSESAERIFKTAGVYERFERFKAGEDVETLLSEAEAAEEKRGAGSKTRHPAPAKSTRKPEAEAAPAEEAKAEAPAAEAEAEESPAAEVEVKEAPAEEPAEEEAPAEEPAAEEEAKEDEAEESAAEEDAGDEG